MTYDTPHSSHAHLDNGACLDGSGRMWEGHARPAAVVALDNVERSSAHPLAAIVLALTLAVLLEGIAVLLLCLKALG